MPTAKATYYYVLCDSWWGARCAIPKGDEGRSPSFVQRWSRVDRKTYLEFRREGFITRTNKAVRHER